MIKAAIEKIQEMTKPVFHEVEGRTFCVGADGVPTEVRVALDLEKTLELNSLDAVVKLIKTEAIGRYMEPMYITIPTHLNVHCFAQPNGSIRNIRQTFYVANATDVPGWEAKTQLPFEEAMIALRTRFQETTDTLYTLKLLSEITTGAKVTFNDNGVATTVVTKRGIDLQSNEAIRPIVTLKPYRTFQELNQPESQFLLRVSERGISFIEADGGMWKLKARETIKAYLEDAFRDEILGKVIVVAL